MKTERLMLDVLKSPTTASGELCVVTLLITKMHKSPVICSDFGSLHLFISRLTFAKFDHTYILPQLLSRAHCIAV